MKGLRTIIMFGLAALLAATSAFSAEDNALRYKLKPGATGKLCLNCHTPFTEVMGKAFVHTPLKKGECNGCHNPHATSHGKLLDADTKTICSTCHTSIIPQDAVSRHRVVAEGECVKCHDPHASAAKDNLIKGGNELCFVCHKSMGEALAKIKFHHVPVDKGCETCHLSHASKKGPFLLKQEINPLCTGCHKTDRPNFAKFHMNYPVEATRCTSCHDPHGSDKPRILYTTVHSPVANRMCNQCHEEGSLKTKRSGNELCRGCHSEIFNRTFDKSRVHWPLMSNRGCLSCHDPHAAKEKKLLRQPMAKLCGSCHDDTMRRLAKTKSKHEPVASGDCTACHDPHASNSLYLAQKDEEVEMCASCHDWAKHSTHPIGEKFKDPRNKGLSLSCRSCHKTHGTDFKKMLYAPTTTELCIQCHEQFKR